MKKSVIIWVATIAMVMVSCKENPYMPAPGTTEQVPDSMPELKYPDPTPGPDSIDVPETAINVYEARKICKKLKSGGVTAEKYYVQGWVCSIDPAHASGVASYGNGTFSIAATNDGKSDKYPFIAYQVYGKGGQRLTAADQVEVGDFVVIYGKLTKYNDKAETEGKGAAYIYASTNAKFNEMFKPADTVHATCAEAKEVVATMSANQTTKDIYVIEGYVQSAGYDATISKGQQKFIWLDDVKEGTKVVQGFYCNVPNATAVPIGTKVRMTGPITKYNGNPEIKNGNVEIIEEAQ